MSSSLAAKSRALTARTVHLKLFPAPRNFNEQREVLRVLERFGEVTMFRFLKHRIISPVPNAFIATFASESSVAEIINAGPIRYRLIPDTPPSPEMEVPLKHEGDGTIEAGTAMYNPLSSTAPPPPPNEQPRTLESIEDEDEFTFELHPSPSILSHGKYITSPHTNPLYGPYPPYPPHKSLVGSMLYKSVGRSMWAPGLRDWETDVERWRVGMADEREIFGEEEEGGRRKAGKWGVGFDREGVEEASSERAIYTRNVKKRREKIPKIMFGVRNFKEEAEREDRIRGVD